MLLIRLLAILAVLAIVGLLAAWLLTGHRKHLHLALKVLKIALAAILLFFGLMMIERLIVIV